MSAAIIPNNPDDALLLWAYCSSDKYHDAVRKVSQKVGVATKTLVQVPFNRAYWLSRAATLFPEGLPKPRSNGPLSYLFSGSPVETVASLAVAAARLTGFSWPRQRGAAFPHCPAIDNTLSGHSEPGGIVCLTALIGEPPAEQRLNALLADAFGVDWSAAKLASLLAEVGYAGKSLNERLRDSFFAHRLIKASAATASKIGKELACPLPPRLRRCRFVFPLEAGMVQAPQSLAKVASERMRY
jgi:hypothetical protein